MSARFTVTVIDRTYPKFEKVAREIHKNMGESWGTWVRSPEEGRFLTVLPGDGQVTREVMSFAEDLEALVEYLRLHLRGIPPGDVEFDVLGTPEVRAELLQRLYQQQSQNLM